jgi:hypothetical protein
MDEPRTFIPQPLSIHTFDEEASRARAKRTTRTVVKVLATAAVPVGVGLVLLWVWRGYSWIESIGIAAGMVGFLLVSVLASLRVTSWWANKLSQATRIEVWPDCVISRMEGRPPLVVRPEDVVSVSIRDSMVCFRTKGDSWNDLVVSCDIVDFDRFRGHVRSWPHARTESWCQFVLWNLCHTWHDPWWAVDHAGVCIGLWTCMLATHPGTATIGAVAAVALSSHTAWRIWRGRHRDKWTRRLVWAWPVAILLFCGEMVVHVFLRFYGIIA